MKTLLVLLALCALTLTLPAETQADRDLYEGLKRSAAELDNRANRLINSGMSPADAEDRVIAEVRARREARDAQARTTAFAASDGRQTQLENENTDGIVFLVVVGVVVAFVFFRRDARRISN